MSISSELQRISDAKNQLRASIASRGAQIQDTDTIDSYKDYLQGCPFAVKGVFVPEEDTQAFSVSGLPFVPEMISIICPEVENTSVNTGLRFIYHGDGITGCVSSYYNNSSFYNFLSMNSSLVVWSEDGYAIDLSNSTNMSGKCVFLAGYTYEYYISGGFAQ